MSENPPFYEEFKEIIRLLEPIMSSYLTFSFLEQNNGKFSLKEFEDFISKFPLEFLPSHFNKNLVPEVDIFSEEYWKKKLQYLLLKNPNFGQEMEEGFSTAKKIFKDLN